MVAQPSKNGDRTDWGVLSVVADEKTRQFVKANPETLPQSADLKNTDRREGYLRSVRHMEGLLDIVPLKETLEEAYAQPDVTYGKNIDVKEMLLPNLTTLFGEKDLSSAIYRTVKKVSEVVSGVESEEIRARLLEKMENDAFIRLARMKDKNEKFRIAVRGYDVIREKDFFDPLAKEDGTILILGNERKNEEEKPYFKEFGSAEKHLKNAAEIVMELKAIGMLKAGKWEMEAFVKDVADTKVKDIVPTESLVRSYAPENGPKGLKTLKSLTRVMEREQPLKANYPGTVSGRYSVRMAQAALGK